MATATKTYLQEAAEAAALLLELNRLNQRPANWLSAKGYISEALRLARVTRQQADDLLAELVRGEDRYPNAWRAIRQLGRNMVALSSRAYGTNLANRLSYYCDDGATAEIAALGGNSITLLALAAIVWAEKHPDCFGVCEDADAHAKKVASLKVEVSARTAKLNRVPDHAALDAGALQNGTVEVMVGNGVTLPLHPVSDIGRRVVEYFANHPDDAGR